MSSNKTTQQKNSLNRCRVFRPQHKTKRGRPKKFPPGMARPVKLGSKRPRGRPTKVKIDNYQDMYSDSSPDCTDTDSISSDQTFGSINQIQSAANFKWDLLGDFPDDLLWQMAKSCKMVCFKRLEKKRDSALSDGDFYIFRCANWDATRCKIFLYAMRKTFNSTIFQCSIFGEHTELCRSFPQMEYGNEENEDPNNNSFVIIPQSFDEEDLVELLKRDFQCNSAVLPAIGHTHSNASCSMSTPFRKGSTTILADGQQNSSSIETILVPKTDHLPIRDNYHFRTAPRRSMRLNPNIVDFEFLLDDNDNSLSSRNLEAEKEIGQMEITENNTRTGVYIETQGAMHAEIGVQTEESTEQKALSIGNEKSAISHELVTVTMGTCIVQTDHCEMVNNQIQTDKLEVVKIETLECEAQTERAEMIAQSVQTELVPNGVDQTVQTDEAQVVEKLDVQIQTETENNGEHERNASQHSNSSCNNDVQTETFALLVVENREQEVQTELIIRSLPETEQSIKFQEVKQGESFQIAAGDIDEDDDEKRPQPLANPAIPKSFDITDERIRGRLVNIAGEYGLIYTVLAEQFWFQKQNTCVKLTQSLTDENELIINSSGGMQLKWRALDWGQFESALRGKLCESFFKSPRQQQLEETDPSSETKTTTRGHVTISWEADEIQELKREFSLTNLNLLVMFEEVADDLLMRFNAIEHGFSLISDERNIQLSFTDHGDDGILLECYEDGELADDTVWARLDFMQFAYAVRGRALTALIAEHEEDEDKEEEEETMEVEMEEAEHGEEEDEAEIE